MKALVLLAALLGTVALADIAPPPPAEPTPAPMHPQGIEKVIPPTVPPTMGVIEGGWGYVYACWGLALGGAVLYAVSLFLRRPTGTTPGAPS